MVICMLTHIWLLLTFVMSLYLLLIFFFSSRRRHTILQGDWSSDVCSSDLWPVEDGSFLTEAVFAQPNLLFLSWGAGGACFRSRRFFFPCEFVHALEKGRASLLMVGRPVQVAGNRDRKSVVEGKRVDVCGVG